MKIRSLSTRLAIGSATAMTALVLTMPSASAVSSSGNWIAGQLTSNAGPPPTEHYVTSASYGGSVFTFDDTGLTIDGNLAFKADGPVSYASHIAGTDAWVQQNKLSYYSDGSGTATCTGHSPSGELYTGPLAKTAFEELANGHSAAAELALLACLQGTVTPGRFSDSSAFGDFSNVFGQSFAIMDFVKAPSGTVAADGAAYLESQQCPSGGFTDLFGSSCATDTSADSTAMAAMALQAFADHSTGAPHTAAAAAAQSAANWLVSTRVTAGPLKVYWTNGGCASVSAGSVNSTAIAVLGLKSVLGPNAYTLKGRIWLASPPQTPTNGEMPGCTDPNPAVQASNDVRATTQGILGKDAVTYPDLLGI